jgi:DNA-binding transcriptional regulator YiaG
VRQSDLTAIARIRAELRSGDARRVRQAAGVSAAEVARIIRVSRATVSDWESGHKTPTGEHALAYGKLLRQLTGRAA